ncbi:ankyrin [Athelia psychrophila]|uniref:Ankyrin n=1 Tax=Athelia psychrophila TaxID=1759441 RepID=A0A166V2S1_9AGAM|nr:ankyrin [Fibularhizoctonia sp. CBS 109695]
MVTQLTIPGSGGVVIPPEMQGIVDQPGYLDFAKGGQKLRNMYCEQSKGFNHMLLSEFAMYCHNGNLERVMMVCIWMVESGRAPDLIGTEGALRFGYATIVVSGKHRITHAPVPMKHAETLSYLLARGCPPDRKDITGLTALTHATQHVASSPLDLARILLVAGANVNHRDRYGQIPIVSTLMTGNIPAIELLMEFGSDLAILDADGIVPRAFFVSKWLGKRAGEEALLAEKQCGNCKTAGPDIALKICSKCRSIKYCSTSCQKSHWPTHKHTCNPFSTANTVSLKPDYAEGMVWCIVPTATYTRTAMGIPTAPTPERHTRGPRAPKASATKTKVMVIKVQVPWLGTHKGVSPAAAAGNLMVYNKKREFVCQIARADRPAEYDRISEVVRGQGVSGAKAYFSAELVNKYELVVKVSEVLAAQPW